MCPVKTTILFVSIGAGCLLAGTALATQTNSMTLTIDASKPGVAISSNFVGISISSYSIDGDSGYTKYFTTADTEMVALFQQIGVKHLRTIMGQAQSAYPDPSNSQIDAFFDFAAACGVNKIIWSLHLFNAETTTNWSNNKAIAAHIWTTTTANGTVESNLLESFAFDNEPDWLGYMCCTDPNITGYYTPDSTGGYNGEWNTWQQAIAAIAPGAHFSGPDTGSKWPVGGDQNTSIDGVPFTLRFAMDESLVMNTANQHYYAGGTAGTNTALELAETCLSSDRIADYSNFNATVVGSPNWPVNASGSPLPYRFTECTAFDNHTNSGNQIFATALWGLDFYHWWAQQGCAGVDPFTRTAQYNSPIYFDGTDYVAEAYAYGMKAFTLGGSGQVINPAQLLINNPSNANVTAYGVVNSSDLYVTIVNKTFQTVGSHLVNVTIPPPTGFNVQNAQYIVLSGGSTPGSSGDATQDGACLGGAEIPNDGSSWAGTWTPLPVSVGRVSLPVQPTTGVIIDLQNYVPGVPILSLGSPSLDANGIHLSVTAPPGSNVVVQAFDQPDKLVVRLHQFRFISVHRPELDQFILPFLPAADALMVFRCYNPQLKEQNVA